MSLYYCTNENNTCTKREECKRYSNNNEDNCHTTLFKEMCTESNNYILFINKQEEN